MIHQTMMIHQDGVGSAESDSGQSDSQDNDSISEGVVRV